MKRIIIFTSLLVAMMPVACSEDNADNIIEDPTEDEVLAPETSHLIDWDAAADSATTALIDYFWNADAGYFNYNSEIADGPDWNYWPQAHAMDVVIDAYLRTGDKKYSDMFAKWYEGIPQKSGGSYFNDFYDDEEWIALTMVRIYEATGETRYLDTARSLWNDIKTGWNDYAGGGIAWKHSQAWSKNSCSNGPAAILACRLYANDKNEDYLEWAKRIYAWQRDILYHLGNGQVYDNINGETGQVATFSLSYNQGTFLGAAHELYKITGENMYLNDARKAANFGISSASNIDVSHNLLRHEGDGDGGLFKGIFMRYYVKLLLEKDLDETYRTKFIKFFNHNAETLWLHGIANRKKVLFGPAWHEGPTQSTQLTSHTSGCMLIEAKAYYDQATAQ